MSDERWAEVAVDHPAGRRGRSLGQTFTYEVPASLAVQVGQLVRVPFGHREVLGVVLELVDSPPPIATRPIYAVVEPRSWLNAVQVALARWLADYYCSSLWDAVRLMVPTDLERTPRISLGPNPMESLAQGLEPPALALIGALQGHAKVSLELLRSRLRKMGIRDGVDDLVKDMIRRGLIVQASAVGESRVRSKLEKFVRVIASRADLDAAMARCRANSSRAALLVKLLEANADAPYGEAQSLRKLCDEAGRGSQAIAALVKQGLIAVEKREVERSSPAGRVFPPTPPAALTPAQEEIWHDISAGLGSPHPGVYLLHGVTASGKTEVYLRLLQEVLAQGRRAIVLVPEIALTPQAIQRYAGRFPGRVGVIHSQLSPGERHDEWRRIREGKVDVVVGPRSALFAPVDRLGAIVLDEEHEWSYKQEQPPRYHARDVAIKLGELASAVVVLGSATPDVGTYAQALAGGYRLLQLRERVAVLQPPGEGPGRLKPGVSAPVVEVIDLRDELRSGNRSIFSRRLHEAIEQALSGHEQVILFLNRRGTATFVMCRDCGAVLRCRRCDASLVYHSAGDDLICHLCNHRCPVPERCPVCRGSRIKFFGVGTQRVELEVRREFPEARVLRWDRDVARTRRAHEEVLRRFQAHEADVLVGTQIVAKGLDFPLVTVVGVVTADTALHLPDFRAAERTFQLLAQVAGRAGRGAKPGRVFLQTYTPEHYCVQAASRHDYEAFAAQELEFRRAQGYPPYSHLALLVCSRSGEASVEREARRFADVLRSEIARQGLPGVEVIGPAPAYRRKVRGLYRWQMLIRGQADSIRRVIRSVALPMGWSVDIDPASVL